MNNQAQQAYLQATVNTAKPEELTLMLYNGLVKNVRLAIRNLEDGNLEKTNEYTIKAQNILKELLSTLDMSFKPAEGLADLYRFALDLLYIGNVKKDLVRLREAEGIVVSFQEMWVEIMKVAKQGQ